jgi:hypothetical protein
MRWKRMNPAQRGAYWQLICWQMQSDDGHLDADTEGMSALADLDLNNGNHAVLDAFPVQANGRRANPRALREWTVRRGISGARSEAGSKGAASRWQTHGNCHSKGKANACITTSTSTSTSTGTSQAATQPPASDAGKPSRKRATPPEPDDAWLAEIKTKYAAIGVDVDAELVRMDGWLQTPKGARRHRTRAFIVGWLNRADRACEEGKAAARNPHRSNLINVWHNPNPDKEARSAF